MMTTRMVKLTGNTYPVRDQIRALGGRWSARDKCWMVPSYNYAEAMKLIPSSTTQGGGTRTAMRRGPRVCKDCGCKINYGVYCGKCEYR